ASRHHRSSKTLGRTGEGRGLLDLECLVERRGGLLRKSQNSQRQPAIETRQLLDVGVRGSSGTERAKGALIVSLAIAQETDVVAEILALRVRREDVFQQGLGLVVTLQTEIQSPELEVVGLILWVEAAHLLERLDRGVVAPK